MSNSTAGIGDPYWYEWSVGLIHIIDMLNPDNGIESVTLQAKTDKGWDDVIVNFEDGYQHFYQIKHTRIDETITFGDIVQGTDKEISLLSYLSNQWKKISYNNKNKFIIHTNRMAGQNWYKDRPPLLKFFSAIKEAIKNLDTIKSIVLPTEYLSSLNSEWLPQLNNLNETEKIQFLQQLEIKAGQEDLIEIENRINNNLKKIFGISESQALNIFSSLDHALRTWTTLRWDKPINREDVYEKLSLTVNEFIGDHNLNPPFPFFDSRETIIQEIENELNKKENKILFLVGKPGSGKTSIISKLANNRNSIIHLRYYSFKPITPENDLLPADSGRTISAKALWGDLLTQLRKNFSGKLAEYNVPIRNDFLDVNELRKQVIRLAIEYSKLISSRITICIDGIDHAARANLDISENYLSSLIPPDNIPPEIIFIIAGQPPEGYDKYPTWLKTEHPSIKRMSLKDLEVSDIKDLCKHLSIIESVAEKIYEQTEGNTLSVLYALETFKSNSIEEGLNKLEQYKLKDGLSTYYDAIWNQNKELQSYPGLKSSIAIIFSLTNSRLIENHFQFLLQDFNLTESGWTTLLNKLSPLVIKEEKGYRILHNDIRIFFTKIANTIDSTIYKNIAYRIYQLYQLKEEFIIQRHSELTMLLTKADKCIEILNILTPKFIGEGYVVKTPKDEMDNQVKMAIYEAIRKKDLTELHKVSCAIKTFGQLEYILRANDGWNYQDLNIRYINEYRVIPEANWTKEVIEEVLGQIYGILSYDFDRAISFWDRWFGGLTFEEITNKLEVFIDEDRLEHNKSSNEALILLGRIAIHFPDRQFPLPNNDNKISETEKLTLAYFNKGLLSEAEYLNNKNTWRRLLLLLQDNFFYSDINSVLLKLIRSKQWRILLFFLNQFSAKNKEVFIGNWNNLALLGALAIGIKTLIESYSLTYEAILENLKKDKNDSGELHYRSFFPAMTAFLIGWYFSYKEPSIVVSNMCSILFSKPHDDRTENPMRILINYSFRIGRWIHEITQSDKKEFVYAIKEEVEKIIRELLEFQKFNGSIHLFYYQNAIDFLLECIHYFVKKADLSYKKIVIDIYEKYYSNSFVYSQYFKSIWSFLFEQGLENNCKSLLQNIIGNSGAIWNWDNESKLETYKELKDLTKNTPFSKQLEELGQKIRWHRIGYLNHKDYSLSNIIAWTEKIFEKHPERWRIEGRKILNLCYSINDIADNRLKWEIESLCMYAALKCNPQDASILYEMIDQQYLEPRNSDLIVSTIDNYANSLLTDEIHTKLSWLIYTGCHKWLSVYGEETIKLKGYLESNFSQDVQSFMQITAPVVYENEKLKSSLSKKEDLIGKDEKSEPLGLEKFLKSENSNIYSLKLELDNYIKNIEIGLSPELQKKILNFIFTKDRVRSGWYYSGSLPLFELLLPLLSEENKWHFLKEKIDRYFNQNEFKSNYSLSDDLDHFCRILTTNVTSLVRGFNRICEMHIEWLTGFENKEIIQSYQSSIQQFKLNSWVEFSVCLLLKKLDTRSALQIEPALRALFYLIIYFPEALSYLNKQWDILSDEQKECILFLLEAVIPNYNYQDISPMESILSKITKSPLLSQRLQAYLVIKEMKRNNNFGFSFFKSDLLKEYEKIIPGSERVLKVESKNSFITEHHHLFNRRIDNLKMVFSEFDYASFENKLLYLYKAKENLIKERNPRKFGEDWIINDRKNSDIFNEAFEHRLSTNSTFQIDIDSIAFAVLDNDDPFTILNDYKPYPNNKLWELDKDISQNELKEKLKELLEGEVSPENIILGGEIRFFRNENIYCLKINRNVNNQLYYDEMSRTINPRSAFWKYQTFFEGSNGWLFTEGYGMSKLKYMNNWIQPSEVLLDFPNWRIDSKNRFRFLKDEKPILWMERLIGSISFYNKYHTTNSLQRWVIKKDVFSELCNFFNSELEAKYDFKYD